VCVHWQIIKNQLKWRQTRLDYGIAASFISALGELDTEFLDKEVRVRVRVSDDA